MDSTNGWELRLGWADSGVPDAPWRLLYAHYRYTGKETVPPAIPELGCTHEPEVLGPLGWHLDYAPPGQVLQTAADGMANRALMCYPSRTSTERVYCVALSMPVAGTYQVSAGAGRFRSALIPVKEAPQLSWYALMVDSDVRSNDSAKPVLASRLIPAMPNPTVSEPIFCNVRAAVESRDEAVLFAKSLPGQCTGLGHWRRYEDERANPRDAADTLSLTVSIKAGNLVLSSKGFAPANPSLQFMVQWRINDKFVLASLPDSEATMDSQRASEVLNSPDESSAQWETPLVLPSNLALRLKPGDKVSLRVLYCPTQWTPLRRPDSALLQLVTEIQEGGCYQPVLSNWTSFRASAAK